MQERIKRLIAERSRALAAVSHDLRTPLTRMRLRAELVEDEALRAQIGADIDDMQAMVESTLDYLRGLRDNEPVQEIDIDALLQSLVADEQALERPVTLDAGNGGALRRPPVSAAPGAGQPGRQRRQVRRRGTHPRRGRRRLSCASRSRTAAPAFPRTRWRA
jgi:signal transduction histidine kinase